MQNVAQGSSSDSQKIEKGNAHHDIEKSSTPQSSNSSPTKSGTETFSELQPKFMTDSSESEEDDVSEVESFMVDQELDEDSRLDTSKFLLSASCTEESDNSVDPETQARLEALLEAAGIGKLSTGDGKQLADPEVLRRLTSSVSCALDEAAAALTRMRTENSRPTESRSLVEACTDGDVSTVRKLLTEGKSVHETTEEGESLLSLACSAGYLELAQVLLAMHANVEDRGVKGDCTPLMEAASAGHPDIVKLLINHGAEVNAQSASGNTPLMYACAGGHEAVVRVLLENAANVEDHNENGHTPLMEAASAGHVGVAKILLEHGAGINTHSNEFKESALTLACYKGHLDMVRFLLEAGADQEHKTDEMHTALMEASMDGHVEVARLLLDSGAQVNMPTDSFESPLTLAACGGHTELAMLLIERGANIEEVNDEGYTPLMEAAREGHEEMVALLLSQGANINAQTEETQETALTLACCGGFLEVADFLLKAGANLELGASTPLMEAAQEGHLELVRYLLEYCHANVNAQTQTGDTALTYACENGHTDVATLLLMYGADLEHESEGGRTPLMKACRAGHQYTVQFLISKNANVNKTTTNNDHTPLSLAAAGGHIGVVELLLANHADPFHRLKDSSTMLIEAAKGGHTNVAHLLLDYPHSIMMQPPHPQQQQEVTAPVAESRVAAVQEDQPMAQQVKTVTSSASLQNKQPNPQKSLSLLRKTRATSSSELGLTSAEAQQVRSQPVGEGAECELNILDKAGVKEDVTVATATLVPGAKPLGLNIDLSNVFGSSKVQYGPPSSPPQPPQPLQQQPRPQPAQSLPVSPPQQPFEVSQNTAISDRPKAKPVSKKEGKHMRKMFNIQQHQFDMQPQCEFPTSPQQQQQPQGAVSQQLQGQPQAPVQGPNQTGQCPPMLGQPVQDPRGITPSQLLAHLQQLDPAITAGVTPSQLQILQQKQLWTLQQQIVPTASVDVAELAGILSDQAQRCQLFAATAEDAGKDSDKDSLFIATVTPTEGDQMMSKDGEVKASTDQIDNLVMDFAHKLEAFGLEDPASEEERLILEARQHLSTEEVLAAEEEAFNLLAQQQAAQDLTYITVPAIQATQQRSNQGLHLQYHQYAAGTTTHQMVPQTLEVPVGLQITSTPLQLPGASGQPITLTRTNEGGLQITGAGATQARLDFSAGYAAGYQSGASTLQLGGSAPAAGSSSLQGAPLIAPQIPSPSTQLINPSRLPLQAAAFPPPLLLPSPPLFANQSQPAEPQPQPQPAQAVQPQLPQLPQLTTLPTSSANNIQMALTRPTNYAASPPCTQVQVATQTTNEKKPTQTTYPPVKGKKARYQIQPPRQSANFASQNSYQVDPSAGLSQYGAAPCQQPPQHPLQLSSCMDVDSETDSNHDTALTLACAGGHEELVELLLSRGADIEHRDKKGFTPLILAATAGHEKVVDILLNHGADIEAQSERTKDTPLSLACSGGRYEVVELLLNKMANKEHRNVSDYTPLSLAASGGYVNIIKLLLSHGAEINSRTGSKLGISPLMLAAMNGHVAAVKLLLDMGSDINAQIETNRNTALTLACFQGRHEVVSLLLDRKANVEHRAKTGLTPLMEAASGGYVEVGRVLIDKGADVNAPPVPSSRDTALTIAADKGHVRFVELLLSRNASVEVKNKKGNSPLWLAANGGHLAVVELLYNLDADIDSQDNRKVSCLMAAFRKGHVKVVKWMVNHVTQFPSDQEMTRFIATVNDKELLEKCHECVKIIRAAKDLQSAKANKNATILLEELDMEKTREESKKAAAARRRERKKKKKLEKKEERRKLFEENKKNEQVESEGEGEADEDVEKSDAEEEMPAKEAEGKIQGTRSNDVRLGSSSPVRNGEPLDKEEGDSGIDANSQGSCSSNDVKSKEKRKDKKKKKGTLEKEKPCSSKEVKESSSSAVASSSMETTKSQPEVKERRQKEPAVTQVASSNGLPHSEIKSGSRQPQSDKRSKNLVFESSRHPAEREDFEATGNETYVPASKGRKSNNYLNHYEAEAIVTGKGQGSTTSPKGSGKREEGWKEVVRNFPYRSKKVSVPLNAISRVIGRGGSNINAIRSATGAHIEVEKQGKGQGERIITIKGSADATKQAHNLIAVLIKDPDVDILQMLPKSCKAAAVTISSWEKPAIAVTNYKKVVVPKLVLPKSIHSALNGPSLLGSGPVASTKTLATAPSVVAVRSTAPSSKASASHPPPSTRTTAPRLVGATEKRSSTSQTSPNTKTTMSYTSVIMTSGRNMKNTPTIASQTFAAKLTPSESNSLVSGKMRTAPASAMTVTPSTGLGAPQAPSTAPVSPQVSPPQHVMSSPKHHRPQPTASAPPNMQGQFPGKAPFPTVVATSVVQPMSLIQQEPTMRSSTPVQNEPVPVPNHLTQEYSLFDSFTKPTMWGRENEQSQKLNFASVAASSAVPVSTAPKFMEDMQTPTQVDVTKAPGYRGAAVCSPVSSKGIMSGYGGGSGFSDQPAPSLSVARPPMDMMAVNMNAGPHSEPMPSSSPVPGPGPIAPPIYTSRGSYPPEPPRAPPEQPLFTPTSFGQDLLKINADSQNPSPMMMGFSHQLSSPPAASSNPNVSMSRLNPRAPDFSVSYPKPQPSQYHGNQNNSMAALALAGINYGPVNKPYQRASGMANGQARWSYGPVPQMYQPSQQEVVFANQGVIPNSVDLLGTFENGVMGNSPSMSPSSPATNPVVDHKLEDRKIPRPIGTERNWKNNQTQSNAYGMGPAEVDTSNWMVGEPKLNWQMASGMSPMFRGQAASYRIPLHDEMPPVMDSSFQGTMADSQFSNGNPTAVAQQLMQLPLQMQQQLDPSNWAMNDGGKHHVSHFADGFF